jgi:hypothetical protein
VRDRRAAQHGASYRTWHLARGVAGHWAPSSCKRGMHRWAVQLPHSFESRRDAEGSAIDGAADADGAAVALAHPRPQPCFRKGRSRLRYLLPFVARCPTDRAP